MELHTFITLELDGKWSNLTPSQAKALVSIDVSWCGFFGGGQPLAPAANETSALTSS